MNVGFEIVIAILCINTFILVGAVAADRPDIAEISSMTVEEFEQFANATSIEEIPDAGGVETTSFLGSLPLAFQMFATILFNSALGLGFAHIAAALGFHQILVMGVQIISAAILWIGAAFFIRGLTQR